MAITRQLLEHVGALHAHRAPATAQEAIRARADVRTRCQDDRHPGANARCQHHPPLAK